MCRWDVRHLEYKGSLHQRDNQLLVRSDWLYYRLCILVKVRSMVYDKKIKYAQQKSLQHMAEIAVLVSRG